MAPKQAHKRGVTSRNIVASMLVSALAIKVTREGRSYR
jgi:hypothetical protein